MDYALLVLIFIVNVFHVILMDAYNVLINIMHKILRDVLNVKIILLDVIYVIKMNALNAILIIF